MDWDTIVFGGITSRQLVVVCSIVIAVMFTSGGVVKKRTKSK